MSPCWLKIAQQWVRLFATEQCYTPVLCVMVSGGQSQTHTSEMIVYQQSNRKYKSLPKLPTLTSNLESEMCSWCMSEMTEVSAPIMVCPKSLSGLQTPSPGRRLKQNEPCALLSLSFVLLSLEFNFAGLCFFVNKMGIIMPPQEVLSPASLTRGEAAILL